MIFRLAREKFGTTKYATIGGVKPKLGGTPKSDQIKRSNKMESLKELIDAAKAAGLEPTETEDQVRFPKRPFVRSGYITLEKKLPKTKILDKISEKMVAKRAKQSK